MIQRYARLLSLLGLLATLAVPSLCQAQSTPLHSQWLISGHASLGLLYNDEDEAEFYRELSQRGERFDRWAYENDTRFGLRVAYRPHSAISGELQLLTKYGPSGNFQTNLFAALVRFKFRNNWMLRAGVIPLESYYRSDSIHAGYSYLWARPPSEVYNYHISSNYTGLSLHKYFSHGASTLEAKLYGGKIFNPLSTHMDDQYKSYGSDTYGFGLEYSATDWTLSLGYSDLHLDDRALLTTENNAYLLDSQHGPVSPELVALFKAALVDSNKISYSFVAGNYRNGPWRINAMLSEADGGLRTIQNGHTGYFSLGYKIRKWTPYWRTSFSKFKAPSSLAITLPLAWQQFILGSFEDVQSDQINYALGARYDLNEHVALKLQVNHIHSRVNPTFLWGYESDAWDQRANFFSLVLDVAF